MDLGIAGRVALIVGGSKGMGLAICEHLVRDKVRVVVAARDQGGVDLAVEGLRGLGGEVVGVSADCTTKEGRERAFQAALDAFGPPDILVYNVQMGYPADFETAQEEQFLNGSNALVGSFHALAKMVTPHMKEQRWGRILTVSSAGIKQVERMTPLIVDVAYRHAAYGFSKVMSNELAPFGITVNTVGPGSVGTEAHMQAFEEYAARLGKPVEEIKVPLLARIPLGRFGKPEEFGAVCAFLCSELAGFVTGQGLVVDGGRYQGF